MKMNDTTRRLFGKDLGVNLGTVQPTLFMSRVNQYDIPLNTVKRYEIMRYELERYASTHEYLRHRRELVEDVVQSLKNTRIFREFSQLLKSDYTVDCHGKRPQPLCIQENNGGSFLRITLNDYRYSAFVNYAGLEPNLETYISYFTKDSHLCTSVYIKKQIDLQLRCAVSDQYAKSIMGLIMKLNFDDCMDQVISLKKNELILDNTYLSDRPLDTLDIDVTIEDFNLENIKGTNMWILCQPGDKYTLEKVTHATYPVVMDFLQKPKGDSGDPKAIIFDRGKSRYTYQYLEENYYG